MINQLVLNFYKTDNPFQAVDKEYDLIWGKINLDVLDQDKQIIRSVISIEWDVKEFLDWIIKNETYLCHEEFPSQYKVGGESIAEYRYFYYEKYEKTADDYLDLEGDEILWEYASHHAINFGMSGTKVIAAYLGIRAGQHEISYFDDKNNNWKYIIDLVDFIREIKIMHSNLRD